MKRKSWTGGGQGEWVHLRGEVNMVVPGLGYSCHWVGNSLPLPLCTSGQSSHLVGPPFLALKVFHSLDRQLLADSIEISLMSGCGYGCELVNRARPISLAYWKLELDTFQ